MKRGSVWLLLGGLVLPLLPIVVWMFAAVWRYPALVPQRFTERGLRLVTDPHTGVLHALVLSTGIGVTVALLACLIGLPAGRALGLYRFRGRRFVQFLLLAPVIVPGLSVAFGLQVFFVRYGLADTVTGVVLVQLIPTVPYTTTVLAGAFANFDVDYERQARVLGAGPAQVLVRITFPAVRPALVLAALFAFLISWSEYVLTLLVGGGQVQTLPLQLFAAINSTDATAAAALAVVVVLPAVLVVVVAGRSVAKGSTALIGLGRL